MTIVGQLVVLVLAVTVQASWPLALRPGGVMPDLTLALVLATGLAGYPGLALLWAVLGGTLLDVLSSAPPATSLLSHVAAALVVMLVAAGPRGERPWLVLVIPPLATTAAYVVAALRMQLAGSPLVWPTLLGVLPIALVLVGATLLVGWLVAHVLGALRRPPVRL